MFRHLVHCDWSMRPQGRWMAQARCGEDRRWRAEGPSQVPADLVDRLFALAADGPTLAAFDFPIGLPAAYGRRTGFCDFREALDGFGQGAWRDFYRVAETAGEIGLHRPFYPRRPGGTARQHLLDSHGVVHIAELTRACERGGGGVTGAGCMLWTLGAQQVGKAALHGWKDVIGPARLRGAKLWPFEGELEILSAGGLTLAESYPGDAYGQIGLSMTGLSKRRQSDRKGLATPLLDWCGARDILLAPDLRAVIRDGFPIEAGRDDGFDAVVGLMAAIEVAAGRRAAGAPNDSDVRVWEGWILGRVAAP